MFRRYPLKYLGGKGPNILENKKIYTEWKGKSTKDKTSHGKCKQQTNPDKRVHVFLILLLVCFVSLKLFSRKKILKE